VRTVLLLGLLSPTLALAAEATDMTEPLRADLRVGYRGSYAYATITEDDASVVYARRVELRHDLHNVIEFSPVKGLALWTDIVATPGYSLRYPEATEMVYDPVSGGGTYDNGPPLANPPEWRGSGLQGVWIGIGAKPFSASYEHSIPVETRFDFAVRTPSKSTLFNGADRRGVSPGGTALRMRAGFSLDKGRTAPWMRIDYRMELGAKVDVTDSNGDLVTSELPIRASSRLQVDIGVELEASENREKGARTAFDLRLGLGYASPGRHASGFYLPSVLDASRDITVTETDYLDVKFGIGMVVDINHWFGFRFSGAGVYGLPHRIEHVYPARTAYDSFQVQWGAELVGRIRTKRDTERAAARESLDG